MEPAIRNNADVRWREINCPNFVMMEARSERTGKVICRIKSYKDTPPVDIATAEATHEVSTFVPVPIKLEDNGGNIDEEDNRDEAPRARHLSDRDEVPMMIKSASMAATASMDPESATHSQEYWWCPVCAAYQAIMNKSK
jgi:hypothetical protein